MWIHHLFSFIGTLLQVFVDLIGTTLLGLLVGVGFSIATGLAAMWRIRLNHGREAMVKHWNEDVRTALRVSGVCAGIIYGPILLWSIGRAAYVDHQDLVRRSREQRTIIAGDAGTLQTASDSLKGKIAQLQAHCANLQGKTDALGNQNRDQQNLIAGCQNDAIKLLAPPPLSVVGTIVEDTVQSPSENLALFVVVSNKVISPVRLHAECNRTILHGEMRPSPSNSLMMGGKTKDEPEGSSIDMGYESPDWTPTTPVLVKITYSGKQPISCKFRD